MHVFRAVLISQLFFLGFSNFCSAQAERPLLTTVCAVMRHPTKFAGRIVRVRATVQSGFEVSALFDPANPSCDGPWFERAPKQDQAPLSGDSHDIEFQQRHPIFLVEDENMKRFEDALRAVVYPRKDGMLVLGGTPRYMVTATMTGRVDYAGERRLGFGHMNHWRVRFLLSSVEDVTTEERSYDWTLFSREPIRFPRGTIRGKLTDAAGKPLGRAWVEAIPAEGNIPVICPKVLTENDGTYSLNVTPGKYLLVVNRTQPAREDVPVLTTYFPSTENAASATILNVADYADLADIDIQIHRTLRPRFFEVQVLGPDGKPAIGAYAYLTQTNQTEIAGQHGVSHVGADGSVRLFGFEGLDYLLWADLGSWPRKQCAPVVRLGSDSNDHPRVVKVTLGQEACSKQEDEARSAAYAAQKR
jgi:hypothetical protein